MIVANVVKPNGFINISSAHDVKIVLATCVLKMLEHQWLATSVFVNVVKASVSASFVVQMM